MPADAASAVAYLPAATSRADLSITSAIMHEAARRVMFSRRAAESVITSRQLPSCFESSSAAPDPGLHRRDVTSRAGFDCRGVERRDVLRIEHSLADLVGGGAEPARVASPSACRSRSGRPSRRRAALLGVRGVATAATARGACAIPGMRLGRGLGCRESIATPRLREGRRSGGGTRADCNPRGSRMMMRTRVRHACAPRLARCWRRPRGPIGLSGLSRPV